MNRSILRTMCLMSVGLAVCCFGPGVLAQTAPALPDFTGIVQKNASAVVHVEAKYTGNNKPTRTGRNRATPSPDDEQAEIMRRLFGMPMLPPVEEQAHTSLGSGFIISPDGYVLTNNHVIEGADEVTVRLQDRRIFAAKVVGTDPKYDIALLKVAGGGTLPAVSVGDSHSLKAGQWVLAIGSPFGFDYTVTQGIVSAVGRHFGGQDQPYTSFIQTDVPINRGNSGGPLFNLQGQVVGINSQIYSNTGDYMGISFSIPIDLAMNAVQQIKAKGYVSRGMLGVEVSPVSDQMVKAFKLTDAAGAAVVTVMAGSGADKAGIQSGDIILAFNGQILSQAADLPPLVGMTKPGSRVDLQVLRQGKKQNVPVVVSEMPRDQSAVGSGHDAPMAHGGSAALGFNVQALDGDTRQQLGLKPGQGVVINDITGQVAADAGLQQGDVILMVNQQSIGSVAAFDHATQGVGPGSTVLLLVRRDDQSTFIGLTVPADK